MDNMTDRISKEVTKDIKTLAKTWKAHKGLVKPLVAVCQKWSEVEHDYSQKNGRAYGMTYAFGIGTIGALALNLYLGEDDSIAREAHIFMQEEVEPALEPLGLSFTSESNYFSAGWKGFRFCNKELEQYVLVRFYFERSSKCELIPTGETTEIMKLVCNE